MLSVGPNQALAGSDILVDPYSLGVGGKIPSGMGEYELSRSTANQVPAPLGEERVGYLGCRGDQKVKF